MNKKIHEWRMKGALILFGGSVVLALAGCGGSEDESFVASADTQEVALNTAADIAQKSADDYSVNKNGLITGSTLKNWIDDWANNRPVGITGKLVILQTSTGEAGSEFISPDGSNVFTYLVDNNTELRETRSNGVIETVSMVPSGRVMDTILAKYDIDPTKDMIVCAQGTAGGFSAMKAGRCWYMLRYWGTQKEHLAVLNGGNEWNATNTPLDASYFSTTGSTPPWTGITSVVELPEHNFALQATLEDMMAVVPTQDANLLNDGVFLWDARGNNLPNSDPTSSSDEYSPDGDSDFRNSGSTQGHPNGALLLSYSNIIDASAGYTFKSKAQIQAYLDGYTDTDGNGFVDSTLQGVGAGNAYQTGDTLITYCETTYRGMITGFAAGAILGLPTRFYDGAMVEWHSMSNVAASDGNPILPWDSPWRTDDISWSMFLTASDPANVATRTIVDAYAPSANAIIDEDMAYKGIEITSNSDSGGTITTDTTTSGGSTPSLPANPCGG